MSGPINTEPISNDVVKFITDFKRLIYEDIMLEVNQMLDNVGKDMDKKLEMIQSDIDQISNVATESLNLSSRQIEDVKQAITQAKQDLHTIRDAAESVNKEHSQRLNNFISGMMKLGKETILKE